MTYVEFRCAHTELPISGCAHCRPAPKAKPKAKPTVKKRVTAPHSTPKEPTMPARAVPAMATKYWQESAACRQPGADPEWWDAASTTTESREARAWCQRCPVTAECLELAMRAEGSTPAAYRFIIYGGLTGAERRDLYDQRRKAAA